MLNKPGKKGAELKKQPISLLKQLPVLNKDTTNSNTYDSDMLLDDKVQKEALSSHRIKKSENSKAKTLPKTEKSSKKQFSLSCKLASLSKLSECTTEKLKKLREEKIQKELDECTFKPKILSNHKPRSPEQYYKDQMKFEEKKQSKLKSIQDELSQSVATEISSFSFAPSLSEKSLLIASKHKYEEGKFERLSKGVAPKAQKKDGEVQADKSEVNQFTFTPVLTLRSQNMLRIASVDEILYEDALRRQRLRNEEKGIHYFESQVNSNSEKMLIESFCKEYMEKFEWEMICYSDFLMILKEMFFILELEKNSSKEKDLAYKLWMKLSQGQESVLSEKCLMHLLAIMKLQTALFTDSSEAISPEETDSLHTTYFLFYENRHSVINHSNVNRRQKSDPDPPFSPEINENSRKIMENTSLEYIKRRYSKKQMDVIKELEEKDYGECTFQPMIHPINFVLAPDEIKDPLLKEYIQISSEGSSHRAEALYNYALVSKDKKEQLLKSQRDKLEEKILSECTFVPNVEKKLASKPNPSTIKESVKRLAKSKYEPITKSAQKLGLAKNKQKILKKGSYDFDRDDEEMKEQNFKEWEERKVQELKRQRLEKELRERAEREKIEEKKRRDNENKVLRYERLKVEIKEKKEMQRRMSQKIKAISVLESDFEIREEGNEDINDRLSACENSEEHDVINRSSGRLNEQLT